MKTIMLVCNAGMSTSMLVKKMQDAAKEKNVDVNIFAVASAEAEDIYKESDIDVLLLGPQIRYMESSMKEMVEGSDTKVAVIDLMKYGQMNGSAVLDDALALLGE